KYAMRTNRFAAESAEAFRDFVLRPEFPCLGAKAAFNSGSQTLRVFEELGAVETTTALADALCDFANLVGRDSVEPNHRTISKLGGSTESRPTEYATFIAIF